MDQRAWTEAARLAVAPGVAAGVTTGLSVAIAGRQEAGSAVAPINATSHIAWGDRAGRVEAVDARHTLVGAALNVGACVFWATFFERWFGRAASRGEVGKAMLGGAAVAATAYVTDYHVVPKRVTPGWELRISPRAIAATYVVFALTLPLVALLRRRL
jgi:RsiW-degrading membrane proteinase PrsW (M82 family)